MFTVDTQMDLGLKYRRAALERGLIYDHTSGKPSNGETYYNFYINVNGDMNTVSDPFKLAELILLGATYTDPTDIFKSGDHKILLNSYANVDNILNPRSIGHGQVSYVHWDYEFEVGKPAISLKDHLISQLNVKSKTLKQLSIRHKFIVFLAESEEKQLAFVEKYLWWIPIF